MHHLCISLNIILWQFLQWDLIAKQEGLGCIIFNEENEQSVESESGNKHRIVQDFDLMDGSGDNNTVISFDEFFNGLNNIPGLSFMVSLWWKSFVEAF